MTKEQILRQKFQIDPAYFLQEVLGIPKTGLWEGQHRICEAVANNRRVTVPSGHALGKDFLGGGLGLWFLYSFVPSVVIYTAPSIRQVKDVMWKEMLMKYEKRKIDLPGKLTMLNLKVAEGHFMTGFTTKETKGQTGKFQGYHSPNILIIVSEAQAVDDVIFEEIEGLMTSNNSKLLLLFNPLRSVGKAARSVTEEEYKTVRLNCLDAPNYKERKEILPGVVSYDWVEAKRQQWGEESPFWYGRVLGLVPPMGVDNVISRALIDKNLKRIVYQQSLGHITSVDFACGGLDTTQIYNWIDGKVENEYTFGQTSAPANATNVRLAIKENQSTLFISDADGLGLSNIQFVEKDLKDVVKYIKIMPLNSNSRDEEQDPEHQYHNLRAQMWFYTRELLEQGNLPVPDDDCLIEELIEPTYFVNKQGRIQIEPKEDIKERLGRSTNKADAFIYGVWGRKFVKNIKAMRTFNQVRRARVEDRRVKCRNGGFGVRV
jgi:hypothetical protein